MNRVFVIMPAYNAANTIEATFARINEETRRRISRYVVIDDGSTDDTQGALNRISNNTPALQIVSHRKNKGYGAAEKQLLKIAREEQADVAILLHADGQYSPEFITTLLQPFESSDVAIVQGSRMLDGGALQGGMPMYKYVANKCLTAIENKAFGMTLAEYHSGYMLYGKEALQRIPFESLSDSFVIDIEMMVCANILGMTIQEIAIPTIYADEESHLNPVQYGFDVLSLVKRYRKGYYHRLVEEASE